MILGVRSIYEKASFTDGKRILVERLWPRGIRRSTANIDTWAKDIAPTNGLRLRLAAHNEWWPVFKKRYLKELEVNKAVPRLLNRITREDITLVYSSRNDRNNNATILYTFLNTRLKRLQKQQALKSAGLAKRAANREKMLGIPSN